MAFHAACPALVKSERSKMRNPMKLVGCYRGDHITSSPVAKFTMPLHSFTTQVRRLTSTFIVPFQGFFRFLISLINLSFVFFVALEISSPTRALPSAICALRSSVNIFSTMVGRSSRIWITFFKLC
jgi:hypothetical protein